MSTECGEGGLLPRIHFEGFAVRPDSVAVAHRTDSFAACHLHGERRPGPTPDEGALVFGRRVQDGAHERVGGCLAIAEAVGAHDTGAAVVHGALDCDRNVDVAREPVTFGDNEYAGAED